MSRAQGCAGATTLKTPYRNGTTHIILEPLDFVARLAALVPKPRVNLTNLDAQVDQGGSARTAPHGPARAPTQVSSQIPH